MSNGAGEASNVKNWTTAEFLAKAASSSPTPGGGSVSAYVGALAASMVCMAANLTLGKEKYREVEPQVREILSQAEIALDLCQQSVSVDMEEFAGLMEAYRLPRNTEEEKSLRQQRIQAALVSATNAPLAVSQNCLKILQLARTLAPVSNENAISDVGVAAYLAESALKSALLNVDINLPQISNKSYRLRVRIERNRLLSEGEALCAEVAAVVQERIS